MHQNYKTSRLVGRPTVAGSYFVEGNDVTHVASPEIELLRILERALDGQKTRPGEGEHALPLVSRIETILGKRLEAANDVAPAEMHEPAPTIDVLDQAAEPAPALEAAVAEPLSARGSLPKMLAALVLLCGLGAAAGTLVPAGTVEYSASGILSVQAGIDTRATFARSVEKTLRSQRLIASTVSALKLDHDPEFSGAATGALNVAADLLSVSGAAIDPVSRAEASLIAAIRSSVDLNSGTIDFSVTTGSIDKSARIAGYLASAVTRAGRPAPAVGAQNDALKKADDEARRDLDAFVKQSGEGNVKVATDLQQQIRAADADMKVADQRIVTTKEDADRLKAAKVGDVLTGVLPPEALSPALEEKRERYVAAKASLAQLATSLGPRHPRLLAQQSETDGLRDAVADELGKLLRQTNDDAKAAAAEKRRLNDRRNALIAQSRDTGVDLARLTELHDKAAAARARLDDAISTGSLPLDVGHVVLRKAPEITTVSAGHDRWSISLFGALAGLGVGLALVAARLLFQHSQASERVEPLMQPSAYQPPEADFDPAPNAEPDEVENLRAQIAGISDRLRCYAAVSR